MIRLNFIRLSGSRLQYVPKCIELLVNFWHVFVLNEPCCFHTLLCWNSSYWCAKMDYKCIKWVVKRHWCPASYNDEGRQSARRSSSSLSEQLMSDDIYSDTSLPQWITAHDTTSSGNQRKGLSGTARFQTDITLSTSLQYLMWKTLDTIVVWSTRPCILAQLKD